MLDNEELTVKIIAEEAYEIDIITAFYKELTFNETNSSPTAHSQSHAQSPNKSLPLNDAFDDAVVADILNQAASLSAYVRRLLYLVINPVVITLGLLSATFALVCLRAEASNTRSCDCRDRRRRLQMQKLVRYYLVLHLLNNTTYLLAICCVSWLYFIMNAEHISAYSNTACRIWQLLLNVLRDLSIWLLIPPLYTLWWHVSRGYETLVNRRLINNKATEYAKSLSVILSDCDNATTVTTRRSTDTEFSKKRQQRRIDSLLGSSFRRKSLPPLLMRLITGLMLSFVITLYTHNLWSYAVLEDDYRMEEGVKRCTTHRNIGRFFSIIWPVGRFLLSNCLPAVFLITMATLLRVRVKRLTRALDSIAAATGHGHGRVRVVLGEWLDARLYRRELDLLVQIATFASLLRLQWCVANICAGTALLQTPARVSTRSERDGNLVLTLSQTFDHFSLIICAFATGLRKLPHSFRRDECQLASSRCADSPTAVSLEMAPSAQIVE